MAGTSVWLTVPTRGDHPDLLADIVEDCDLPRSQVVVVATAPDVDLPTGVRFLYDLAPLNIHRWWNLGLYVAAAGGASHVLVVNDDITLSPATIPAMLDRLDESGAAVCWAHPVAMTGWCWLLDLASSVRPDEAYRWWYGDDDLIAQCAASGRWPVGVDAGVTHRHGNETTEASPALQELALADLQTYRRKWGLT